MATATSAPSSPLPVEDPLRPLTDALYALPLPDMASMPTNFVQEREHYHCRRQASSSSTLLDLLSKIEERSHGSGYTYDIMQWTFECTYEIVRGTLITVNDGLSDTPQLELMRDLVIAVAHLQAPPEDNLTNNETRRRDSILALAAAIEDYDNVNREVLPPVHTVDIDRRLSEVTLTAHRSFVQSELTIYGSSPRTSDRVFWVMLSPAS